MSKNRLSKSTFIRGTQCEKSLYLYKHNYNLKDPTPSSLQALFDQGTNIGILAQELFPNGVGVSPTFLSMVTGTFKGDVDETRRQLLEYCKLDTFAMVRILDKLRQV